MRKAVAYYRVSTGRQGQSGLGLAAQRRMIYQYCKANKIELIKEFREVKSGEEDKNRPIVQKAVNYCLQNGLQLIVAKQSRLGRSVFFIASLIKKKVDFISVDMPHANNFQRYLQAAIDEQFLDDLRSNTRSALQAVARKGGKLGGNPEKLKRTLKRKRRSYFNRNRTRFRKIQREHETIQQRTDEFNRLRITKLNGKRGGWHVSEVYTIYRDLGKIR